MFNFRAPQGRVRNVTDTLMIFSAKERFQKKLENGNKILLPSSFLQQLIDVKQNGPMIFRIQSTQNDSRFTYVGVLEFIANEGECIVPTWLFENMGFFSGCFGVVSYVQQLPKGKLIQLQPHETEFIDLPDPRAILESQLRNYVCLTEGETITINAGPRQYQLDIKKVEPTTQHRAVNINDADVEIDFLPPLDYQEAPPNLVKKSSSINYEEKQQAQKQTFFAGQGVRIDGKSGQAIRKQSEDVNKPVQEAYNPRKHKLQNGVKPQDDPQLFQGNAVRIGNERPPIRKQ
ncbi:hypothetical protein pb186bvf_005714 [Paramecium bursaria]